MVLGITAGCKVGTFHLWGAGSSHCHRGPGPQGNEAADPCSGPRSHPAPNPDTSLGLYSAQGIRSGLQKIDRFTGAAR